MPASSSAVSTVETSLSLERAPLRMRSEEHTSELQSRLHLVCRLLLEKKNNAIDSNDPHSTRRAMWTMKISRTGGCDSRCCILLAAFALANTAPMPSAYGSKTIAHTCV